MKSRLFLFLRDTIVVLLCTACMPIASPVADSTPIVSNSPTPTRPAPTNIPIPTLAASLTPDPRAIYEGECTFCFVDGSDPLEPVWDVAAQGFTYQEADPRERIVLDENYRVG